MTIAEITDYIFLSQLDPAGDASIVFGSMYANLPVEIAVNLYNKGKVNYFVFTGSVNKYSDINEAYEMDKLAGAAGIPSNVRVIESKASNTLENVLFSKKLLDEKLGLKNIHALVGIMVDCHARRALMTIRKHFPEDIKLSCATYSFPGINRSNWHTSDRGRRLVYGELERIEKYLAKGDIAELQE